MMYNDGKVSRGKRNFRRRKRNNALSVKQTIAVRTIAKKAAMAVPEKKYWDYEVTARTIQPPAAVPISQSLCDISQGDAEGNRDGNHITPTYLGGRYTVTGVHNASQLLTRVRIMVVRFRSNTAQAGEPIMANALESAARPFSFLKSNQTKVYQVLYDARHHLVNDKTSDAFTVYGEYNLKLKNDISFNDNNTTGEDKLYLLAVSDYNGIDVAWPTLTIDNRMRFIDA